MSGQCNLVKLEGGGSHSGPSTFSVNIVLFLVQCGSSCQYQPDLGFVAQKIEW